MSLGRGSFGFFWVGRHPSGAARPPGPLPHHHTHTHAFLPARSQIHFLWTATNGVPNAAPLLYLDSVFIPAWAGTGPYPNVTLRMDFSGIIAGELVIEQHSDWPEQLCVRGEGWGLR